MRYLRFYKIGDLAVGRDNNFNLLRLIAALCVLLSHTVLVTKGEGAVPQQMWLLGTASVWVFFVISGFLISASFRRRSSVLEFALARCLRIFPALVVCVVLTALALGASQSRLPLGEYYTNPQTYRFLFGNISLFMESRELPGVFENHPESFVQVTFWSLKFEVLCYLYLAIFGVMGLFSSRGNFTLFFVIATVIWMALVMVQSGSPTVLPKVVQDSFIAIFCFVLGMAAYEFRDRIYLSGIVAMVLILSTWLLWWTPLYHGLLPLTLAYCALWGAFVPHGPVRAFNALGDYSYGVYIFGFPIQQLMVTVVGDHSPFENFIYSAALALPVAAVSWHFIERPCLAQKKRLARALTTSADHQKRRAVGADYRDG